MSQIKWETKVLDEDTINEVYSAIEVGDGFWYSINEGYIDPEKILSNPEQLKQLNEALSIIRSFEALCEAISEDCDDEDCDDEDE